MRYTRFPDLFSSRSTWTGDDSVHQSIDCLVDASLDILIVAWAVLLRSYTEEVAPTFKVYRNNVTVNTSDWSSALVKYVTTVEGDIYTGIVTDQDSLPNRFDLLLQHKENDRSSSLICSRRVPSKFLSNIWEQLVYIIHQRLDLQCRSFSWHQINESERSIVNKTPQKLQGPELLHKLLERHANNPACALVFRSSGGFRQDFSYKELHSEADRLAVRIRTLLQSLKVADRPEQDVIPVLIPQCAELYISILAILKAGAAFCPLHLDAPVERIKFIIEDVAAQLVITTSDQKQKIAWENAPVVMYADKAAPSYEQGEDVLPNLCEPKSLAYIMYTSGSTGQPKGVGISHFSASQALLAHDEHIPTFHRFLQFAAPTFDVFVFEMFFPLYRGKTLVGCNRTELLTDLPAMINSLDIDAAELTPTVVGTLIHKRSRVPKLKVLLTIGEMLTRPVINEFGNSLSREGILHGMYGPTEATIHCTLATKFSSQFKVGIIGVPLATVSCLIIAPRALENAVSKDIEILPIGHVGELAVAGLQLADGYINRAAQTSSAFYETRLHGRIYRTGDKARLLPDGRLECLGRISAGQVKLRGQRIELGEIEQSAYRTEGINSATAAVIGGIIVLFCMITNTNIKPTDVLDSCRRWLPGSLVPGDVVLVEDIPRLPSGKVDVLKLQIDYEQEKIDSVSVQEDQPSATEARVSRAVEELLGHQIDISASFSAAGLDSLAAIRLASKLQSAHVNIGVVDILKADTIRGLATILQAAEILSRTQDLETSTNDWISVRKIALIEVEKMLPIDEVSLIHEIIPCTSLQIAMLSETKLDNRAYCNWIELECSSALSVEDVKRAFLKLARQNEILRTGFVESRHHAHPFVQVIWSDLPKYQICQVGSSNYTFQIRTPEEFLRPLRVQIETFGAKPKIIVKIHHALYDGWSWEHVVRDFDLILRNRSTIERPQFREIVNFYRRPSVSTRSALSREYWQSHLQESYGCILPNLHGKKGHTPGLGFNRIAMATRISDVNFASRALGVSPQSVFQAAFAWLLSLYMGSSDIIFGTVSSGRTLPVAGIEDIIGPCIATLPVRLDVRNSRTVQDLIQVVHRLSRQMLEHHELPLREIKKACGIDPGNPLFDSVIVWQQTLKDQRPEILTQLNSADHVEFNLTLEVEPGEEIYELRVTYQQAIFPEIQAEQLLHQMDQLINIFTHKPSTPLTDVGNHLGDDILSIENPEPKQHLTGASLSHPIEVFAKYNPTRTAIDFAGQIKGSVIESERVSYSTLNRRANQVAHYLLKHDVSPDDLVSICMEKSVDLYIGILGIIKARAGYLPLTPETPLKRRQKILYESKVKICLCHSSLVERGEGQSEREHFEEYHQFSPVVKVLYVDKIDFDAMPDSNPTCKFRPSDLAYAVFTSGSTGTAKGVLVTQGNIVSNLRVLSDIYPVADGSRLLQSCLHTFDVSVFEIFFAWSTGMCLCSATKDVLFRDLENTIRVMEITHLSLTPTVAALVQPKNTPLVRFLVTAGEALTDKVFKHWAGKGLYQGYGPSETTNICTVRPLVTASDKINNIGPPLPNTSAFVRQGFQSHSLVPRGGVGEFLFGGEQVFRGYLNMPALNAEKIINHPKFGRVYCSGDYGRMLWDGSLEYVGRQDDQVKIRGQRVELGEINNLLLQSPQVIDAFTFVDQTRGAGQRLLTFWVPEGHIDIEWRVLGPREIERSAIARIFTEVVSLLPAYMVPSVLVPISCIPMTAYEKADKRRLIDALSNLGRDYMEYCSRPIEHGTENQEWSELELQISLILCQTIECPQEDVGRRTSFFSLGLDSFSAVSFSRSLREHGFHDAEASLVLRHPTILALCKRLTQKPPRRVRHKRDVMNAREVFDRSDTERIRKRYENSGRIISQILPCTPLQEAMLSALGSRTNRSYYNYTVFEIHGDIGRLRKVWQSMALKHDILRTSFSSTEDGRHSFAQIILSSHRPDWSTVKVSDEDLESAIIRRMDQVARVPTDFDPPYSFTAFQSANKTNLLISMHHALYDGEATQLLLSEVKQCYDGRETPPAVSFEPVLEMILSLDLIEADSFWNNHLRGLKPTMFPRYPVELAANPVENPGPSITTLSSSISLQSLEELCRRHSISLLGLTQASWAKLLSLYLGTTDICFGNVVSGRTLPLDGIDQIVAPCFNTLPVRFELTSAISNLDLIKKVQQLNFDALPYQFTPLRRIQRTQNRTLFDSIFILQKSQKSLDNHIWSVKRDVGSMDTPIVCEVTPLRDRDILKFNLYAQVELGSQECALNILETLDAVMQTCIQYPSGLVTDFGFLDRALLEQAAAMSSATNARNDGHESPATTDEGLDSETEFKIDWTSEETEILDVFAKLSNVKRSRIGLQTTIFRLGLDSISAVQIAAHLRENGWKVSPVDVLEHPMVRQLASHLQSKGKFQEKSQIYFDFESFDQKIRPEVCVKHRIGELELECVRPCTWIQSGIIAAFISSNGFMYFNSLEIQTTEGDHSLSQLRKALVDITGKYQMLRTGFSSHKDSQNPFSMLIYHKDAHILALEIVEDGTMDGKNSLQEQTKLMGKTVLESLHLPAWRVVVFKRPNNSWTARLFILHALFDALSLNEMLSDLANSYRGEHLTTQSPIDSLLGPILVDSASNLDAKRAFWEDSLKGFPITKFPNTATFRIESSEIYSVQQSCELSFQQVQTQCKELGVTVQSVGQATWARVLSMYTGEARVIFGSVYSGRTNIEGSESVAFPSIVTLPICARVDGNNRELLDSLMSNQPSLLKHQFTPLSKIQRWAGHDDEPLFDTIFVYQIHFDSTNFGKSWEISKEIATADYSLSVELIQCDDNTLNFRLVSSETLLPRSQASILLSQLSAILTSTLIHPNFKSYETSSFPTEILSRTPAKEPFLPSEVTLLHEFVERQANIHPHNLALEFTTSFPTTKSSKKEWTYGDLNLEGNKIAHLLIHSIGVKIRTMIAICFRKCPQASFAILGILKAGSAFVAIDPDAPVDRQRFIIKDSGCALVLAMSDTASELGEAQEGVPVIILDAEEFLHTPPSPPNYVPPDDLQGDDLSYCLYTSGTSGTPKACLITHSNAVQAMLSFSRLFSAPKFHPTTSRFLQFASFHFDVSVLEQFWSWSEGIIVVSAPRDLIFEDLAGTIRELGVTHLDLTPSLARTLNPVDVPKLADGVFITGGEQLLPEILEAWGDLGCIYNGYGPTETTIGITMYPRVPKNGKSSNIGPQFDNVGSYVFRPGTTSPVLRGAVGELCVSGALVGPGYFNRPDVTQEKFPFLAEYGERVYRTGDLVRILHDNTFDFLGRADDQVKLRGQRLEVREVNMVIKRGVERGVCDVATLAIEHVKSQRKQLVSFFVPIFAEAAKKNKKHRGFLLEIIKGEEARNIASQARDICQGKLPPYMVPTHFIPVSAIPLSSNNKVENNKLKALYESLSSVDLEEFSRTQGEPQLSWSDAESKIVDILLRATGSELGVVTRNSSIFRLGLDSISVVNFARTLKDAGFLNAQVSTIMQNPMVGQLCKVLSASPHRRDAQSSSAQLLARQSMEAFRFRHVSDMCRAMGISLDDVETLAPCTPLQEGIISRSLSSAKPLYFEKFCFELLPEIEINQLQYAWTKVVASVQALRTRFCPTIAGYAQVVCKSFPLPWEEKKFATEDELDKFKCQQHHAWWAENHDHLGGRPFEILVLHSNARRLMVLHIFHALYDGLSLPMILQKFEQEYSRILDINYGPPFLETLPFGPLCEIEGAKEFWVQQLSGLSYQPLPSSATASKYPPITSLAAMEIPSLSVDEVRRSHNTTHQSLIQAAWMMVLRRHFPSEAAFGVVVSGRSIDFDDAAKVIGPLFNTIPFCPNLDGCLSWSDIVGRCHEFNAAALPYQHSSLRDINKWCQRSPENPLFETLFIFQREIADDSIKLDSQLWTEIEAEPQADYPISFEATLLNDGEALRVKIVAQDHVSSEENSIKMLEDFHTAFSEIASDSKKLSLGAIASSNLSRNHLGGKKEALVAIEDAEFDWSSHAYIIRDEIALLADCEPSVLNPHSSIFALGLDSIDAVKLSSRLRRRAINLSVSKIMHNTSVARMVLLLQTGLEGAPDHNAKVDLDKCEKELMDTLRSNEILNANIEAVLPPTPLQEVMFADMLASSFSRYFNQDVLLLDRSTDIERLSEAFFCVVEQSPILRTTFIPIDDPRIPVSFAQVIHKPGSFRIRQVDVDPEANSSAVIQTVMKQDRLSSSDGPGDLFKLTIIHGINDNHLVLSLSHALYDGWSLSLLHKDIRDAYYGRLSPRPSYRNALEHILDSSTSEAASYWADYISDAKCCAFPARSEELRSPSQTYRLEQISSISASSIKAFVRRHGVTMQSLGQTCWTLVLGSYLKSLEVVFGVVLSGRDIEEANQVMFPTMNTIVVRSIIHGSAKQLLLDMQNTSGNAVQYQHFPLRKVQAAARKNDKRLFDSLFIFQRSPVSGDANEKIYESIDGDSSVEFPVCVEMELFGDNVIWRTACEDTVFDSQGAKGLIERLESVLQRLLQSPAESTIDLTEKGTAIFGLPAFQAEGKDNGEENSVPFDKADTSLISREWTAKESVIRKILSDVSHVPEDQITKRQSIFNLGLDSISAIKVSSLLRKHSINLSVGEMLKADSIAKMAVVADETTVRPSLIGNDGKSILLKQLAGLHIDKVISSAGIDLKNVEKTLPCGPGQVYMLSTWLNSGGALFYSRFHYESTEHLDRSRLSKAWELLVNKFSILRTVFAPTGNRKVPFLQVVLVRDHNPVIWLSEALAEGKTYPSLDRPLVSLTVLPRDANRLSHSGKTSIYLDIHHALYDGVSLDLLVNQLQELYRNPTASFQSEPQFEDFLAAGLIDPSQKVAKSFWSTYLSKSEHPLLPQFEDNTSYARRYQFTPSLIPSTENLFAVSKHHGISIQALFFTAYARVHAFLLSRLGFPNKDIVFGIYLANRSHPIEDLPNLASPTLNLVPLRVSHVLCTSILESANKVQRDLHFIGSVENSGVGLWEIFDWTGLTVDCFVNFLSLPSGEDEMRGIGEGKKMWVAVKPFDLEETTCTDVIKKDISDGQMTLKLNNTVAEVYRQSIDIEATICGDGGGLDVGIWFPERLVGSEEVGWMMRELGSELARVELLKGEVEC